MYSYRQIFKQAFKIAWHYPSLWFFGFFVALMGAAAGSGLFFGNYGFGQGDNFFDFFQKIIIKFISTLANIPGVMKALMTNPVYMVIIALLFLIVIAVSILLIWLMIVSQSALIAGVINLSKDKKVRWQANFNLGLSKFWPILGINLGARIVTAFLFLVVSILTLVNYPGANLVFTVLFYAFLFASLVISFILKFATCGIVLKNWKFKDSIKPASHFFWANWLLSLELSLILFVIYILVNLFLFVFLALFLLYAFKFFVNFTFGLFILVTLAILVFLITEIILAIFYWAVWAIVFEIIIAKKNALLSFSVRVMNYLRS
jgi:hypothetical protein